MIKLNDFTEFQLTFSTADDEKNYFSEKEYYAKQAIESESNYMQDGTYRVIEDVLYRIAPGIPPDMIK